MSELHRARDGKANKAVRAPGRLSPYCLDLLCRLTCSAARRMRRLMASCSLRANASITAMSFAVGFGLSRKSARRSQGTRKSSLSFCVEASGVVTVSIGAMGSELFNGISTACQGQYGVFSLFVPYRKLCISRVRSQGASTKVGAVIWAKR